MKTIVRSATTNDEHAIKELLKSSDGVWQESWRDEVLAVELSLT
jgi:hypothetical protein